MAATDGPFGTRQIDGAICLFDPLTCGSGRLTLADAVLAKTLAPRAQPLPFAHWLAPHLAGGDLLAVHAPVPSGGPVQGVASGATVEEVIAVLAPQRVVSATS